MSKTAIEVNTVSMKLRKAEIEELIGQIEKNL